MIQHFLSRAPNQRRDDYGGSLENPARFVNAVIGDIRDAVGIHRKLDGLGVDIVLRGIAEIATEYVASDCISTGKTRDYAVDAVVLVTSLTANDQVYQNLLARQAEWADAGILGRLMAFATISARADGAPIEWFKDPQSPAGLLNIVAGRAAGGGCTKADARRDCAQGHKQMLAPLAACEQRMDRQLERALNR